MKSVEFCYWLQGFFEISTASSSIELQGLTKDQTEMIKEHLQLVFVHEIDPSYPKEQQDELNQVHNGPNHQSTMRC